MALINPDGKRTAFTGVRGGRAREGDWLLRPVSVRLTTPSIPAFAVIGPVREACGRQVCEPIYGWSA